VITQATENVNFYESQEDIGSAQPYAVVGTQELTAIIRRFVAWATKIAAHPELAKSLGEANTSHIVLATSFRTAVRNSERDGTFPNVVLPSSTFTVAMKLMEISRQLDPRLGELLADECRKWEEDSPA
jgi:hypothetical protein